MKTPFLMVPLKFTDGPLFRKWDHQTRGLWLSIALYCREKVNGGRILEVKDDNKFWRGLDISKAQRKKAEQNGVFKWGGASGEDLILTGYHAAMQSEKDRAGAKTDQNDLDFEAEPRVNPQKRQGEERRGDESKRKENTSIKPDGAPEFTGNACNLIQLYEVRRNCLIREVSPNIGTFVKDINRVAESPGVIDRMSSWLASGGTGFMTFIRLEERRALEGASKRILDDVVSHLSYQA